MSNLISLSFENTPIIFTDAGYLNATKAAAHYNKKPENYLRSKRTKEYLVALKSVTEENQLVIVNQGGKPEEQGTWLHPKLVIDFARWLKAEFAVWCDTQIEKILHPEQPACRLA